MTSTPFTDCTLYYVLLCLWRWIWWPLIQVWLVITTVSAVALLDLHQPPRVLAQLVALALPGGWVLWRWVRWAYRKWGRPRHA